MQKSELPLKKSQLQNNKETCQYLHGAFTEQVDMFFTSTLEKTMEKEATQA